MRISGTKIIGLVGAFLLVATAGAVISAQSQKSAEDLYQAALVLKEGRGDLEEAIKIFVKILADFPKERAVTGKAQLQIGLCYEKLGETKALEAFRKVIADFQDQPEVVKIARARLDALAKPAAAAGVSPQSAGMTLRQVDLPDGKISPDGRWIAIGEYEENIFLYEIATKKKTPLTRNSTGKNCCTMIMTIDWSPSGLHLAYNLLDNESYSVHIIDLTGANDKVVYLENGTRRYIDSALWLKDEGSIFLILSDNSGPKRRQSVGILALAAGEFREIRKYEGDSIGNGLLSPDGRSIVCSFFPDSGSNRKSGIVMLNTSSGTETFIDEHPELSIPAAWTSNGSGLIFTSRRSGTDAVWILPMSDGKTAGDPRLIREFSASVRAMGIVESSLYLRETQFGYPDVYTAQVDLATGKTIRAPELLEKDYRGISRTPFWSPDGRMLAYLFQSAHRPTDGNRIAYDTLRIRDLSTNEVKNFRSPIRRTDIAMPRWSPDGKYLFLYGPSLGPGSSQNNGIYRVDANTGESSLYLEDPPGDGSSVTAITANGKTIYKVHLERGETLYSDRKWLSRMDMDTKQEKELYRADKGAQLLFVALSDDDQWLGFLLSSQGGGQKWCVMPALGGDVRILYEKPPEEKEGGNSLFFWGPPGKGFLFRTVRFINGVASPTEIWHIANLERAEPKLLELKIKNIYVPPGLSFHPDCKTVAFQTNGEYISNCWILENFLPLIKSEK